ncbi:hypothetical protein J6590_044559 [Homalodisca vitripennis]|nr:hypothetical protein J6590_044559 [Homalodisca vitripennis]
MGGREKVVRMVKPKSQIESRVNLSGLNTNARYHHSPGSKMRQNWDVKERRLGPERNPRNNALPKVQHVDHLAGPGPHRLHRKESPLGERAPCNLQDGRQNLTSQNERNPICWNWEEEGRVFRECPRPKYYVATIVRKKSSLQRHVRAARETNHRLYGREAV